MLLHKNICAAPLICFALFTCFVLFCCNILNLKLEFNLLLVPVVLFLIPPLEIFSMPIVIMVCWSFHVLEKECMFLGNLILYSTFVDRVVAKFSLSQLSGPKSREKFLRVIVNKQSYPGPVCVGCNEEYCSF